MLRMKSYIRGLVVLLSFIGESVWWQLVCLHHWCLSVLKWYLLKGQLKLTLWIQNGQLKWFNFNFCTNIPNRETLQGVKDTERLRFIHKWLYCYWIASSVVICDRHSVRSSVGGQRPWKIQKSNQSNRLDFKIVIHTL